MNVEVRFTETVDDDYRRDINRMYDRPGLATRAQVREWFIRYGRVGGKTLTSRLKAETSRMRAEEGKA